MKQQINYQGLSWPDARFGFWGGEILGSIDFRVWQRMKAAVARVLPTSRVQRLMRPASVRTHRK
jgi:hypothetical protein